MVFSAPVGLCGKQKKLAPGRGQLVDGGQECQWADGEKVLRSPMASLFAGYGSLNREVVTKLLNQREIFVNGCGKTFF